MPPPGHASVAFFAAIPLSVAIAIPVDALTSDMVVPYAAKAVKAQPSAPALSPLRIF
ncbi:MAG: hypothetical protein ACTTJS_07895 [Wolinella sp.]